MWPNEATSIAVGFRAPVDRLNAGHPVQTEGGDMSIAKTIEVTASSKKGFEDAIKQGVAKAAESLANITGAWVMDQSVKVNKGKITEYSVRMKLTFVLK
jgi:flavin-binding protein dodecin